MRPGSEPKRGQTDRSAIKATVTVKQRFSWIFLVKNKLSKTAMRQ